MRSIFITCCLFVGFPVLASAQYDTGIPHQSKLPQKRVTPATGPVTTGGFLGGGDDCAAPTAIAGQGVFAFDTTAATTGSQGQAECGAIHKDVWFNWTADATGTATVQTCGLASFDTKLAAYLGSACPANGSSLACNDDACGLQSSISFPVTSGSPYMIQVGAFGATQGGPGSMNVSISGPAVNDDCSSPSPLNGQGIFNYDNSSASTGMEGQNEANCFAFGTSGIDNDIWFDWTADADGTALIRTCGSSADTKIAAYPSGGCPPDGTSLACNDDACGLQSTIGFDVTNGTTYLLQVGSFPGAAGAPGILDIAIVTPPDGYAYDTGVSSNSLGLTAGGGLGWLHGFNAENGSDTITEISTTYGTPLFPGLTPGQPATVGIWDDPTNDFDPTDGVLLYSAPILTANEDTDMFNAYSIPDVAVNGVFFVGIVANNIPGQFPAPMDETFPSLGRAWIVGNTTNSGGYPAFDFMNLPMNDLPPTDMDAIGFPSVFLLRAEGAGEIGTPYCVAAPNSVSIDGSEISATGSTSLAAMEVTLHASNAPAGQPAIFYFGENPTQFPFGNGFKCVQDMEVRLPVIFEAGGEYTYMIDFGTFGGALAALGTAYFQCWYRDPAAGGMFFNLSDGLEIVFTP